MLLVNPYNPYQLSMAIRCVRCMKGQSGWRCYPEYGLTQYKIQDTCTRNHGNQVQYGGEVVLIHPGAKSVRLSVGGIIHVTWDTSLSHCDTRPCHTIITQQSSTSQCRFQHLVTLLSPILGCWALCLFSFLPLWRACPVLVLLYPLSR